MYPASQPGSKRHTLSVLVENRPGVLARIAGLFARRAFNINSLSVSPTEAPMAAGRPKPIVPRPPEEIHECGFSKSISWADHIWC